MPKYVTPSTQSVGPISDIEDVAVRRALRPLIDAHNNPDVEELLSSAEGRKAIQAALSAALNGGPPDGSGTGSPLYDAIVNSPTWKKLTKEIERVDLDSKRAILEEQVIRGGEVSDIANRYTGLLARTGNNEAGLLEEVNARTDSESALIEVINTMWALTGGSTAVVQDGGRVVTTIDAAEAAKWAQLEAEVFGAEGEQPIRTALLQEANLRADLESGIESTYTVRLEGEVGGKKKFAGFGLGMKSDGEDIESDFLIAADRFAFIVPGPAGEISQIPFSADANGVYINSNVVRIDTTGTPLLGEFFANVVLSQDQLAFVKLKDSATVWPSSIQFSASVSNMAGATFQWFVDGVEQTGQTSATFALPQFTDVQSKKVKVRATAAGLVREDEASVFYVIQGDNAVAGMLTNESHTLPGNTSGVPISYSGASGRFIVAVGGVIQTSGVVYSLVTQTGFSTTAGISINASTGEYSVTSGINAELATVTFSATLPNGATIDKVFTITTAKTGSTGAQGPQGPAGSTGSTGATGSRGPGNFYRSVASVPGMGSSTWNSNADSQIQAVTGSTVKVVGDTVTLYTSTNVDVGRWNGSSWVSHGVKIDGDLVVNGTITGAKLAAASIITADAQIDDLTVTRLKLTGLGYQGATIAVSNGFASGNVTHSSGRYVLPYAVVVQPTGVRAFAQFTGMGNSLFGWMIHAFYVSDGSPYTGNVSVGWGYL